LTVHNVNAGTRDGKDGLLNRLTLRIQYLLHHHLFVHTELMKRQLQQDFGVPNGKISVIPFGLNSTVPDTALDAAGARVKLALAPTDQVLLFFGNIAPYKGLEFLVRALVLLKAQLPRLRLIIAGRPKGEESYWKEVAAEINAGEIDQRTTQRIEYVPDADTEIYFKAADVVVLPYTNVFQSGVLFLAYNFGVPVIASEVASMREDIVEGTTGLLCRPADVEDLASTIKIFFSSDLSLGDSSHRRRIQEFARERYSWTKVATETRRVYKSLIEASPATGPSGG
jgi:glycosyltransferase involved in cell wall biosynthesis